MFSKGNKDLALPDQKAQASSSPKRSTMKSKAPSILSGDIVITGSIVSDGEVQMDGTVDGDIRAGSLIIGEDSSVNGEVYAETVVIRGKVSGSIRARQVQLASTARIEGDIVHAALSVESGAFFDGNCRHASDPLNETGSSGPANDAKTATSKPPAPSKPAAVASLDQTLGASKSSL
jgi:cytoskeletal protein CcmA (bactofilin family)